MSIIYCLVDPSGQVWASPDSYADAARAAGVDVDMCAQYRFNLATRRLTADRGTPEAEQAVRRYVDEHFGTPEKVIRLALDGGLPKLVLADLLAPDKRPSFLEACAKIERRYTEECIAANDPCLSEPGCGLEEWEICLQPLVRAGTEFDKACAAEWVKLFADPRNRVAPWAQSGGAGNPAV